MCYQRILFTTGLKYLFLLVIALLCNIFSYNILQQIRADGFWFAFIVISLLCKGSVGFFITALDIDCGYGLRFDHNFNSIMCDRKLLYILLIDTVISVSYLFYTSVL